MNIEVDGGESRRKRGLSSVRMREGEEWKEKRRMSRGKKGEEWKEKRKMSRGKKKKERKKQNGRKWKKGGERNTRGKRKEKRRKRVGG